MSTPRIVSNGLPHIYFNRGSWRMARPNAISWKIKDQKAFNHVMKLNEAHYGRAA